METKKKSTFKVLKKMPQRKTKKLRSCVGLFSLFPDAQGEDYEEEQFAN